MKYFFLFILPAFVFTLVPAQAEDLVKLFLPASGGLMRTTTIAISTDGTVSKLLRKRNSTTRKTESTLTGILKIGPESLAIVKDCVAKLKKSREIVPQDSNCQDAQEYIYELSSGKVFFYSYCEKNQSNGSDCSKDMKQMLDTFYSAADYLD